jgi:D-alanine--poly(phosphoribitol) ligase subunit 1
MASRLLHEYADAVSLVQPDRQALTDGRNSLTYGALSGLSNRLARGLLAGGLEPGRHVVLAMARSVHVIAAILGVLKAGGVYVPTLADQPAQRRRKILKNCNPHALVGDASTIRKILAEDDAGGLPPVLVCLGDGAAGLDARGRRVILPADLDGLDAAPVAASTGMDDAACVHYTSGSTGDPKGVVITHRNIDEYIAWAVERIGIGGQDRILGTAPFHFDMSLFDVYGSLRAGASLCIADERKLLFPALLVDFAERERVTIWKGVSSLLMYLVRTGAVTAGRLGTLQKILFSGEVLPTKYLIQWMNMFPGRAFYNAYGPTEATGISTYYRVKEIPASPDERIPIGIPCENTEVLLLDENRHAVPPGETGELHIKGVCVTRGYLGDPDKTAEVFIDNPLNPGQGERLYKTGDFARLRPDGNYDFVGRKDHQVKYMGYRIELTDIEQTLVSIAGVKDAGLILAASPTGDLEELVAYLEIDDQASLPEIIAEAKRRLPLYMVPKQFSLIPRMPRTDGGKLSRPALQAHHKEQGRRS